MPSIVDQFGIGADPVGELDLSDEQISRTVDLIIIQFREKGVTFTDIGKIMGRPRETVRDRFYAVPEEVRRHYRAIKLG